MEPLTAQVTVRYWAAIRQAAGVESEQVPAGPLSAVLSAMRARHDDRYAEVLAVCSLLLDGERLSGRGDTDVDVPAGAELDCLPPCAGG